MGDLQTLLEKAYAWTNGVLEHVLMVIYFMEKHFSFLLKFSVRFWKLVQDGPTYNLLAMDNKPFWKNVLWRFATSAGIYCQLEMSSQGTYIIYMQATTEECYF